MVDISQAAKTGQQANKAKDAGQIANQAKATGGNASAQAQAQTSHNPRNVGDQSPKSSQDALKEQKQERHRQAAQGNRDQQKNGDKGPSNNAEGKPEGPANDDKQNKKSEANSSDNSGARDSKKADKAEAKKDKSDAKQNSDPHRDNAKDKAPDSANIDRSKVSDSTAAKLDKDDKAAKAQSNVDKGVNKLADGTDQISKGSGDDLKTMYGDNSDGSMADSGDQAIAAAKTAGKVAARAVPGGQNGAYDGIIDGAGKAVSGVKNAGKNAKNKVKDTAKSVGGAASGKAMQDAMLSDEAKQNLANDKRDRELKKQKRSAALSTSPLQAQKKMRHANKAKREENRHRAAQEAGRNEQQEQEESGEQSESKTQSSGGGSGSADASGFMPGGKKLWCLCCGCMMPVIAIGLLVMLILIMFAPGVNDPDGQPSEESDAEVAPSMGSGEGQGSPDWDEEGGDWLEVAHWSVDGVRFISPPNQPPWTVPMGIAAEATELGRFSPYDSIDRDPNRDWEIIDGLEAANTSNIDGAVTLNSTGEANRTNPAWRAMVVTEGLVDAGYTEEQAAGIIGNMTAESGGVEPAIYEAGYNEFPPSGVTDNFRGYGIAQWTFERHEDIKDHIESELGLDPYYTDDPADLTDDEWMELLELQVNYVIYEMTEGGHRHVQDRMDEASSVRDATKVFLEWYEIPVGCEGNSCNSEIIDYRNGYSESAYELYQDGGVDAIEEADGEIDSISMNQDDEVTTSNTSTTDFGDDHSATASCPMSRVEPEIGGGEGEGVGPYLLTPTAAQDASDAGYDPHSPCVGRWIVEQFRGVTADVNRDSDYPDYHDEAPFPEGYGETVDGLVEDGGTGAGSSEVSGDGWAHPTDGTTVTSVFGVRSISVVNNGQCTPHNGTDFDGNHGDPVYAAHDGTVADIENTDGSGWIVYIDTEDGDGYTRYHHMRGPEPPGFSSGNGNPYDTDPNRPSDPAIEVEVGDTVEAGEYIGEMSDTGYRTTGSHLHFEVHNSNGDPQNPEDTLEDAGVNLAYESFAENGISGCDQSAAGNVGSGEVSEDDEEYAEQVEMFEDNIGYWEAVIYEVDLFVNKNDTEMNAECILPSSDDPSNDEITRMITYSFHCVMASNPTAWENMVLDAGWSPPPVGVTEEELEDWESEIEIQGFSSRQMATEQLIEEAFYASYAISDWDTDRCEPAGGGRQGLFGLTTEKANEAGISAADRCDPAENVAAAARLFIEEEMREPGSREGGGLFDSPTQDPEELDQDNDVFPFRQYLGGWGALEAVVGLEGVDGDWVSHGSLNEVRSMPEQCREDTEDWLIDVAEDDDSVGDEGNTVEGFVDLQQLYQDEGDDLSESQRQVLVDAGRAWVAGTDAPWMNDDCAGTFDAAYAELLGEMTATLANDEDNEDIVSELTGMATWFQWMRHTETRSPRVGADTLVPRLTNNEYAMERPPTPDDDIVSLIRDEFGSTEGHTPLEQRAVEYAVYFGGLSQPFDSAHQLIGSLAEEVARAASNSGGSSGGASNANGQTEISADECPSEVQGGSPESEVLNGGSADIGIEELCERAVDQARNAESAEMLIWAFNMAGREYRQLSDDGMASDDLDRMSAGAADCSSLITRGYKENAGVDLYDSWGWSTVQFLDQSNPWVVDVPTEELVPGDWYLPDTGHVTLAITDGYQLHAINWNRGIVIDAWDPSGAVRSGYIDPEADAPPQS